MLELDELLLELGDDELLLELEGLLLELDRPLELDELLLELEGLLLELEGLLELDELLLELSELLLELDGLLLELDELLDDGRYWLLELRPGGVDELELLLLGGRTTGGLGLQGGAHGGAQLGG